MSKRRTYIKITCDDCKKNVGRNNWGKHIRSCLPYKERLKREEIEWAKTAPIEQLTVGLAEKTGRFEEFKKALEVLKK